MPTRRAAAAVTTVLLALTTLTLWGGGTAAAASVHATAPAKYYAIGDSVMIDARPNLPRVLPSIQMNTAVSRQVSDGVAILADKHAAHTVAAITIFGLGTNGTMTATQLRQIIAYTAGHKLVMITSHCPYCSWTAGNNKLIRSYCSVANHCYIAEFQAHANYHPEWFGSDGVHMAIGGTGAGYYAHYVWLACHHAHLH